MEDDPPQPDPDDSFCHSGCSIDEDGNVIDGYDDAG